MSIEGIFLASEASGPMKPLREASVVEGRGIEGDRYFNHVGTYSCLRASKSRPNEREPGRQLTLIAGESVRDALQEKGLPCPELGDLRRNIVLNGVSADDLLNAMGHVIKLGKTCRVLVHRHCVPCMYNERKNAIPGLVESIWKEAGVNCEVLQSGAISVGDPVEIMSETRAIDDGHQSLGFYVPPSQRSAAMVKDALARQRQAKQHLMTIDPEGVERVEKSYNSVGLKFWPAAK